MPAISFGRCDSSAGVLLPLICCTKQICQGGRIAVGYDSVSALIDFSDDAENHTTDILPAGIEPWPQTARLPLRRSRSTATPAAARFPPPPPPPPPRASPSRYKTNTPRDGDTERLRRSERV